MSTQQQHDAPDSGYTGPDRRQHRGWRFDPTVNAGHVITFLGMAAAVFIAWANLDKRVLVLEERGSYQKLRDDTQDQAVTQQLVEIKSAIGDVRRGVDEIRREQMGKAPRSPLQAQQ